MCIPQTSIIVKSQLIKDMMTDQMVFINLFMIDVTDYYLTPQYV